MWTKPTTAIENAGAGGEVREADGVADNSGEEDFPGPVVSPVPRVE